MAVLLVEMPCEGDQGKMAGVVYANRKAIVAQIITVYSCGDFRTQNIKPWGV